MKILSWNINGFRAVLKKGFNEFLEKEKPDILCLQEIKICANAQEKEQIACPGYDIYWNHAVRPGYSGTAILVKQGSMKKFEIKNGIGSKMFDDEGRVQIMETSKFYLINTYFPNANHELSRLGYKLKFNNFLLKCIKKLNKSKPVILTGDYNVAHEEIDLKNAKANVGNPGFTDEERAWMTKFLRAGFIDTFRDKHGSKEQYSWWSYRFKARDRNIGWRIDYFCVPLKFKSKIKKAFILDQVKGSDHCPVGVEVSG